MNILKVLYSPFKAFSALKSSEKFPLMSLILLLVIVAINNILMIPVTAKVMELTFSSIQIPLSEGQTNQMDTMMQMMYKLRYLQALGAVFTYCFMLVVYTLIIWILTKIAKQSLTFQKAFELMIHCSFVLALGALVNVFVLYAQGIENITNMYEISLTGLNLLTSADQAGVTFYTFLSLINPFYVWFLILLTIGIAKLTETKISKAFIPAFLFWAIIIAFPVVMVFISQQIIQKTGLF